MKKSHKSKKHPKAEDASNDVEKEKVSSQPKKMGSETDEISAKKKRKSLEKEKASPQPKKMGSETDEISAEKKRKRLEKEKPSPQPKKKGSEIDEIFAASKRKKLENEKKGEGGKPTKAVASKAKPLEKQKGKSSKNRNSFREHSSSAGTSQTRKKTVDGLTVYTEEELGLGKPDSGGTGLCPFDCNCCF